jgi:uncharacterized membrane protein
MGRFGRLAFAIVFVASVGLNLVFAGFVLERATEQRRGTDRVTERAVNVVLARLPEEVRKPLLDAVLGHRAELTAALRDVRRSRREVRAAMRAEPLDIDRVRAALSETRDRSNALLAIIDGEILHTLPQISAADRAKIAVTNEERTSSAAP